MDDDFRSSLSLSKVSSNVTSPPSMVSRCTRAPVVRRRTPAGWFRLYLGRWFQRDGRRISDQRMRFAWAAGRHQGLEYSTLYRPRAHCRVLIGTRLQPPLRLRCTTPPGRKRTGRRSETNCARTLSMRFDFLTRDVCGVPRLGGVTLPSWVKSMLAPSELGGPDICWT